MWNEWLVTNAEFALKCIFSALELSLVVPMAVYTFLHAPSSQSSSSSSDTRPTVVIVGGNFAGLAALWQLKPYADKFRIVVIEQKEYFEYIPGILRLFCEPSSLKDLAKPLPRDPQYYEIIQGRVTQVEDPQGRKVVSYHPIHASMPSTTVQTLAYDYLILATGATYSHPITPSANELSLAKRQESWNIQYNKVKQAQSILILGAGAVGIELAAEIIDVYPQKSITLLDANSTMAPLFPAAVGIYAKEWLQSKGVTVRLGEMLQSWDDKSCTLQTSGKVLKADIVFVCFGSKANSQPMDSSSSQSLTSGNVGSSLSALGTVRNFALNRRKDVVVKNTLQVEGGALIAKEGCVFVAGDVADPPSEGIKQAFQAEVQGYIAGKNVVRKEMGRQLLRYPQDVAHSDHMPLVYVLSLGRFDGVLGFNQLTIPGPLAAIVKFIIEYTKVMHMGARPLGALIWKLGDNIVMFLSRTLIKPALKKE